MTTQSGTHVYKSDEAHMAGTEPVPVPGHLRARQDRAAVLEEHARFLNEFDGYDLPLRRAVLLGEGSESGAANATLVT